jgi:hypothetical protein
MIMQIFFILHSGAGLRYTMSMTETRNNIVNVVLPVLPLLVVVGSRALRL